MPQRIKCPPTTGIIAPKINSRLGLKAAMSELVDNAADKGAKNIVIHLDRKTMVIEDDGRGVVDLPGMVTIGRHDAEKAESTMGRYGVGFKDSVIWLGRYVEIETRHHGIRRSTVIDWIETERSKDWEFEFSDPIDEPDKPSFTRITVTSFHEHRLRQSRDLGDALARRFAPGILKGISIIHNGETLIPPSLPELTDTIVIDDDLDGLHFRATIGILADPKNESRFAYDVAYHHRLIRQGDDDDAFGDYSKERLYGYVELFDDGDGIWTVSQYKDEFEERPELYALIFDRCQELFAKADSLGHDLQFRDLEDELSTRLSGSFGKLIREKRRRKTSGNGTHEPKGTPKKRTRASKSDPSRKGSVKDPNSNSIVIKFDYVRDDHIGEVQFGQTRTLVHLNPQCYLIAQKDPSVVAAIACALLANELAHDGDKGLEVLEYQADDALQFIKKFTEITQALDCTESSETL